MNGDSAIERTRRGISRVAIAATLALLTTGLVIHHAGSGASSLPFFRAAFFVLVAMPIVAVVAVVIEEIRRRDWIFTGAALVVLGLIAYSIFR